MLSLNFSKFDPTQTSGLNKLFGFIVTIEDVAHAKPALDLPLSRTRFSQWDAGSGLFGSKRSESRNSLSRRFSCVRLARHPKPIFARLAAFEDRPSKCHRASDTAILINEPNPTETQRNRRFFNSLPFAGSRFNGPSKSLEKHWLPLVFPHLY